MSGRYREAVSIGEAAASALRGALGPLVLGMMEELAGLPEERRGSAQAVAEIKTVDGHVWTISVAWYGFEGPDLLERRS